MFKTSLLQPTCEHPCADASVHARSQGRLPSQRAEPANISAVLLPRQKFEESVS